MRRHAPTTGTGSTVTGPSWSIRLAALAVRAFLAATWVLTLLTVAWNPPEGWAVVPAVLILTGLVTVQWVVFSRPHRPPSRRAARLALLAQAGQTFLPYLAFGESWFGNPGMLIGSMLLVLRGPARILGVGVVAAALGGATSLFRDDAYLIVFQAVDPVFTGLVVYGLTRLAETVHQLRLTRHDLARQVVAEQRMRYGRRLRHRLGGRLAALVAQVGDHTDATGIDGRIREALAVAHDALADARELVREGTDDASEPGWRTDRVNADLPRVSQRLANGVLAAVLGGFGILAFTRVLAAGHGPLGVGTSLVLIGVLLAIQIGWFGRPAARTRRVGCAVALIVQATLLYAPIVVFGYPWLALTGFLAGSLLLVLRPAAAVPLALAVVGSVGWIETVLTDTPLFGVTQAVTTATSALVVFALSQLAVLVARLQAVRARLAEVAAVDERLRFSRDLHDLLGLGLSAIAMKLELAARLHDRGEVGAARTELGEVDELARRALGDVRSVAGGDHDLALVDELDSARSVLSAAGLEVRIRHATGCVLPGIEEPLALAVREGATNVLRHASGATWCELVVRDGEESVALEVSNDGAGPERPAGDGPGTGNGLANLAIRLGRVGGTVRGEHRSEGVFRLHATVPTRGRPSVEAPAPAAPRS